MRLLILALMVWVFAVGASAQAEQVADTPEGNPEAGRRVFNDRGCYQCHGYEAHAGPGSRLAPNPIPFTAFSRYVRAPRGQMPPYTSTVLSDIELANIYAFLKSIPEPPPVESIPALNNN